MAEEIDHPLYPKASLQEADAVAWILTSKDSELVQYPFKFWPLEAVDVRLKILYTSICQSDIMHSRGYWGPGNYPCCPGHEVVGEITKVGQKVTQLKVGDKVAVSPVRYSDLSCRYCKKGHTQMCDERIYLYGEYFGGYCTHLQIDHNWVFKIPQGLDLRELPPILCAGITVFAPLKRYRKVGAKVAVLGIGGLGHLAIQYANKLGMIVTAFTTKTNNTQSLKQLGATDVQHSTNQEQLAQNQGKYDIVLSNLFIDNPVLYKLYQRLTKPQGVHIVTGVPNSQAVYQIDNNYLIDNQITLAGTNVASINEVKETLEFSAHYGIQSINQHFGFEDFPKAFHRVEKKTPRYRAVVNVTDWAKANGFDK